MGEGNESSRTIKVVDRRKFTADGEPKVDDVRDVETVGDGMPPSGKSVAPEPEVDEAVRPGVSQSSAAPDPVAPPRPSEAEETSGAFLELVAVLAQQAEMLMAGVDDVPAQPDGARRMIDYLGALEAKTMGNLSPEEEQALTNILFQLRSLFVQSTG